MSASPIAIFAAGFVAGGLILGGSVVYADTSPLARVVLGGVLPGQIGDLFCINANGSLRTGVRGQFGPSFAGVQMGGPAYGVGLRCPT